MRSVVLLLCLATVVSAASLKLPQAISSHMVLQRAPVQSRLWGWATAGDKVTVAFSGTSTSVTVDTNGTWTATLPATKAGGPYDVVISTGGGDSTTLTDVMFGDVFVCSGQSNMEFSTIQSFNSSVEIADADNYPNLRVFETAEAYTSTPQDDCKSRASSFQWGVSSSTTIGGPQFQYFSAVCYFFGRDVYRALNGTVPIGLIATAYGGTCLEAWSSQDIVNQCTTEPSSQCYVAPGQPKKAYNFEQRFVDEQSESLDDVPTALQGVTEYSCLYNAMMHPLIKFAISGFVWYQGENNWQDLTSFACRMPMFVQDIRDKFEVPDLPFYYVDCAPGFGADLREAQASALTKPFVYRVNTIDIADPASPYVWYHPRNKQSVGYRMSLIALNVVYNQTNLVYNGPQPATLKATYSGSTTTFDLEMDKTKLQFADTAECYDCCAKAKDVFLVADSTGQTWSNATSYTISSSQPGHITITANVENASGVSLDWTSYPSCALYDTTTGLPSLPFQVFVQKGSAIRVKDEPRHRSHVKRPRRHHN